MIEPLIGTAEKPPTHYCITHNYNNIDNENKKATCTVQWTAAADSTALTANRLQ